jgi:cell division transport system permease protein
MKDPSVESELAPPQLGLKRGMPLVPDESVAGRALVVVIAIMTFLACLTAGGALLVAQASGGWRSDVLRDVTIQVKPRPGDDIESLVAQAASVVSLSPGVESVRVYSNADSEKLLEPWLGEGVDLSLLPIPRILVVHMRGQGIDGLAGLKEALSRSVPEANLDDHRVWAARIGTLADAIVALAAALFALMILAMATAIGFATRGTISGNREIIEVLHFIGASDGFIAREFQTHFSRLGFRGALAGVSAAIAFFLAASAASSWWTHSRGGEEVAAMFGAFALGLPGYATLAAVGVVVTFLTGVLSRAIVFRHLKDLH